MKVAIIGTRPKFKPGTREWLDPDWVLLVEGLVRGYVRALPAGTVVVSGGAIGPDRWAVSEAQQRGLPWRVFKADWAKGRGAGFDRNGLIVQAAEKLVAFYDMFSHGTGDTLEKARVAGLATELIVVPEQRGEA